MAELRDKPDQRQQELKEALAREAATAEILRVISSSPDDTQPVFETIVKSGSTLFPDAAISVALPVGDQVHAVAVAESDPARAKAWRQRFPFPLTREYMHGLAILEGQVIDIPDVTKAPDQVSAGAKNFLASGYRAVTMMPLMRGNTAIGVLSVVRLAPGSLAHEQVAVLRTFAAQAVIAIENVRQFRELQTRLEREAATRKILQVISQSRDDEAPVFEAILENACRLCDAPLAYLSMTTEDRTHVISPARRGAFAKFGTTLDNLRVPLAESRLALARAIAECRVFREDDIANHDLYTSGDPNRVSMVEDEGARSLMVVPLISKSLGIGSITLYRRKVDPFQDDDVTLVESFAAQAVIAIENVHQFKVSTPEQNYTTRRGKSTPLRCCGRLSIGPALRSAPKWLTQQGGDCGQAGL